MDRDADLGVPALVDDDSMIGGSREAARLRGGDDIVVRVCVCVFCGVCVFGLRRVLGRSKDWGKLRLRERCEVGFVVADWFVTWSAGVCVARVRCSEVVASVGEDGKGMSR